LSGPAKYYGASVACDLSETIAKVGLPVGAVLGTSFLMEKTIALDYRDGLVAFN